jgi:hypothetical protein
LDVATELLARAAEPFSAAKHGNRSAESALSSVSSPTLDSLHASLGDVGEKQETSARGAKRKRRTTPQQGQAGNVGSGGLLEGREEEQAYGPRPDQREQGRILGLRQAIEVTWSSRFGPMPASTQEHLAAITDAAKLDALLRVLVTSEDSEEAAQVIQALGASRPKRT